MKIFRKKNKKYQNIWKNVRRGIFLFYYHQQLWTQSRPDLLMYLTRNKYQTAFFCLSNRLEQVGCLISEFCGQVVLLWNTKGTWSYVLLCSRDSGRVAQYLAWWYALWSRGQQRGTDDFFPPSPISPAPNQHILKRVSEHPGFFQHCRNVVMNWKCRLIRSGIFSTLM